MRGSHGKGFASRGDVEERGLFRLFSQPLDMVHDAEVDGAAHVARPKVEIPAGTHVQRVPTGTDQGRGAVMVILKDELAAMQSDVAVSFGIGRLLDDVEAELFVRDKFGDAFLDHNAITENALAISADDV